MNMEVKTTYFTHNGTRENIKTWQRRNHEVTRVAGPDAHAMLATTPISLLPFLHTLLFKISSHGNKVWSKTQVRVSYLRVSSKRKCQGKVSHPAASVFQVERRDCFKWGEWTITEVGRKIEVNIIGVNNTTTRKEQSWKGLLQVRTKPA